FSVTGLPFHPELAMPAYVPADEDLPLQVADAYALSKQVDEASASMAWRRHGLSVVAMRFPFLGEPQGSMLVRLAELTDDPAAGIKALWSYLDVRDGARACLAALTEPPPGYHVVGLAAPLTLCPYPTEALLSAYLPDVPLRRELPGRTVPIDLT